MFSIARRVVVAVCVASACTHTAFALPLPQLRATDPKRPTDVSSAAARKETSRTSRSNVRARLRSAPPPGDSVMLEVRIGWFARSTVLAFETSQNHVLVPASFVLKLAEIAHKPRPGGLVGSFGETGTTFELDARRNFMRRDDRRWRTDEDDLLEAANDIYVSTDLLSRLLNVDVVYDHSASDLEVRSAHTLPIGSRLIRAAAEAPKRALLKARSAIASLEDSSRRQAQSTSQSARRALLVDYAAALTSQTNRGTSSTTPVDAHDVAFSVDMALPALHGVFIASADKYSTHAPVSGEYSWLWSRPSTPLISTFRIGDVHTRGLQSVLLRGFQISNSKSISEEFVVPVSERFRLPADWEVDAMRGNQLVAVSNNTGSLHELTFPVAIGSNTVRYIARGPNGDERIFSRSYHTPSLWVLPGTVDYDATVGQCATRAFTLFPSDREHACTVQGTLDVRAGIRRGWVVRAGADVKYGGNEMHGAGDSVTSIALGTRAKPHIGLSGVMLRSWVLDATVAPSLREGDPSSSSVQLQFEPTPSLAWSGSFIHADNLSRSGMGTEVQLLSTKSLVSYINASPSIRDHHVAVDAWGVTTWTPSRIWSDWRIGTSMHVNAMQIRPYVRREEVVWRMPDPQPDVPVVEKFVGIDLTLVPTWRSSLAPTRWWMRGSVESSHRVADNWELSVSRAFDRWRIDVGARHAAASRLSSLNITVVSQLPQLQISGRASSGSAYTPSTTTVGVHGGAAIDPASRTVAWSADPVTARSGIVGSVFLDLNGDGKRQTNERTIPNVRLIADNREVFTDRNGAYTVLGVSAHSMATVSVDTTSFENPTWMPTRGSNTIRVSDHSLVTLDIPISITAAAEGSLMLSGNPTSAGTLWTTPLLVLFSNVETGAVKGVQSFSDGTFYLEGVPTGRYAVTIDRASLTAAGLTVNDAIVLVEASGAPAPVRLQLNCIVAGQTGSGRCGR